MASATQGSARDPLAGRLPVTLITGFLGSGKTTLLSKVLVQPAMKGAAVVINEIGELSIDHDLVAFSTENVSVLANGCICCTVRTDLQETLRDLFGQRRAGQIPDFDRVVVETTGLADPAPVVQTLVSDTMLGAHFRLDGVITLVDAVNAEATLDAHAEATRQVALADLIVVTKTDLALAPAIVSLKQGLQRINESAEIIEVVQGDLPAERLTGLGLASSRASAATLSFLGRRLEPMEGGEPTARLGRTHSEGIRTHALRFDEPFTWSAFTNAMTLLTQMRGPDLLRAKGIVNVEGQPVIVQCVQHIFHPAVPLDDWPSEDHGTRLVFITRHVSGEAISSLFAAVRGVASGQ